MLELLASDSRSLIQEILTYSIFLAALIWGAGPERAMIATWVVFFDLLPIPYTIIWGESLRLQNTDLFLASADLCAGLVWVTIAVNANRNYPMFVAALQLLVIAAHAARGVIDVILPVAYVVMIVAPGWLQLFVMAAGLWRHVRRERKYGPYRDWRVPTRWLEWLSFRLKRV